MVSNLHQGTEERDFFVWVDPKDFLARHQIEEVGSFFAVLPDNLEETLMFLPNPKFRGLVSPFQSGLLRNFIAEYNLELGRQQSFPQYPCRLQAVFLFQNESEAQGYRSRHGIHVGSRVLKRARSVGPCIYSTHDSSWVDFLRLGGWIDPENLDRVSKAYWTGQFAQDCQLQSMGCPWTQPPIIEVLFLGHIEFYDRTFDAA